VSRELRQLALENRAEYTTKPVPGHLQQLEPPCVQSDHFVQCYTTRNFIFDPQIIKLWIKRVKRKLFHFNFYNLHMIQEMPANMLSRIFVFQFAISEHKGSRLQHGRHHTSCSGPKMVHNILAVSAPCTSLQHGPHYSSC